MLQRARGFYLRTMVEVFGEYSLASLKKKCYACLTNSRTGETGKSDPLFFLTSLF